MIPKLEESLQLWCQNQDSDFFATHLYDIFRYYAASLCTKYGVKSNDIPDTIQDLMSHSCIELPLKYDNTKGTCKAALYILMSRYLFNKIRSENQEKRDKKKLIFIEDVNNEEALFGVSSLYEFHVDMDKWDELKTILLSHKCIFNNITGAQEKKIKDMVIRCIEHPEEFQCEYNSYVKDIAKKSKSKTSQVYYVLEKMHDSILSLD